MANGNDERQLQVLKSGIACNNKPGEEARVGGELAAAEKC